MRSIFCLLVAIPCACAQVGFQAPLSGYVFDAGAGALRPIVGLPGGAQVGGPIDIGVPVASAVLRGSTAMAISGEEEPRAFLVSAPDRIRPVAGASGVRVAYLNRSASIGLLETGGGEWRFVEGLRAEPHVTGAFHRNGTIAVLLEENDSCALAAGESGALERICANGLVKMVGQLPGRPLWLEWVSVDRELAAGFAESGGVTCVDIQTGATREVVTGLGTISAVASAGTGRLYVYAAGVPAIHRIRMDGSDKRSVDLPAAPVRLDPLARGAVLLSFESGQPLIVIDGSDELQTFFIPVAEAGR